MLRGTSCIESANCTTVQHGAVRAEQKNLHQRRSADVRRRLDVTGRPGHVCYCCRDVRGAGGARQPRHTQNWVYGLSSGDPKAGASAERWKKSGERRSADGERRHCSVAHNFPPPSSTAAPLILALLQTAHNFSTATLRSLPPAPSRSAPELSTRRPRPPFPPFYRHRPSRPP